MSSLQGVTQILDHGWVGAVVACVGIAIALYIYRLSSIGARLVHQQRALRLIGKDKDLLSLDVEIRFKGSAVERLTKTYIVVWNAGRSLIRGEDIAKADPPTVTFSDDSSILEVNAIRTTRAINKFAIAIDPAKRNVAAFGFDYLDPGDGAVIEVLHTAKERFPLLTGSIKGMPRGIEDWGRIMPLLPLPLPFPRSSTFAKPVMAKLFGTVAFLLGVFILTSSALIPSEEAFPRWVIILSGLTYLFAGCVFLWAQRRRFPKAVQMPELFD